jgi:hypothetical protein
MCHIFTWQWHRYIWTQEEFLGRYIWWNVIIQLYNTMLWFEEQMTNILDKVIFEWFKQTKEYKEIIKLIK